MKDKKIDEEDFLEQLLIGISCAFIFNVLFVGLISISVRLVITFTGLAAGALFLIFKKKEVGRNHKK